ncbi:GGDEF domain-containing protein [Devosia yakushimensis]|uniref:diguanylate cyclase n=1 Tax=Devosia yakushimensis TaxID=470028 RepID=A0ABQ5UKP3_9HYPH|nr:GGDEF domain-containing protein [Devosia yakushimensis]GLQ12036.1 GGDEF domain-containing protein [Devosia yakushimensis]
MSVELFISVLTPTLALILAGTFAMLWWFRRSNRHIAMLAICYACVAAGFALQATSLGLDSTLVRFCSNLMLLVAVFLLCTALLTRAGMPVPRGLLLACAVVAMLVLGWFMWAQPSFVARVVAVTWGIGAMLAIAAIRLSQSPQRSRIDVLMLVVLGMGVAYFLARPFIVVFFEAGGLATPDITSSYWLLTNLATIAYSLLVALTLLTAVALDVIEELQAESQTDPLSRLLNRRGFDLRGARLLSECAAQKRPVVLVLADLDHFKRVNDRYGHEAGDQVIVSFARRLQSMAPAEALVGRLGGEEFAVLLPLTNLQAGMLYAEAVRSAGPADWAARFKVTASFGVVERQPGEGLEQMVGRADAALYQAKRDGRDRVRSGGEIRTRLRRFAG